MRDIKVFVAQVSAGCMVSANNLSGGVGKPLALFPETMVPDNIGQYNRVLWVVIIPLCSLGGLH